MSKLPTRLLFLDIDGVLCTPRAVMAQGAIGMTLYFDPVAVNFLNQLYMAAPFRIVVTSTWRKFGDMQVVLGVAGVLAPCHEDSAVSHDIIEGESDSLSDRPYQINQWLEEHDLLQHPDPDDTYGQFLPKDDVQIVILDDDSFKWTPWQKKRWVKCDSYDGVGLMAMNKAFELFGVDWPAKDRPYPT